MTGGARVGWVGASWPFGRLIVTRKKIILKATLIGKYEFVPQEVVSVEEYGVIPFLGRGIQIIHNKNNYPRKIVFGCLGNPMSKINKIKQGFFRQSYIVKKFFILTINRFKAKKIIFFNMMIKIIA